MLVPSQGHYGFHSFPVVDWFCLFIYLWVLTFPLQGCSEFGNFVITLINFNHNVLHLLDSINGSHRVFFFFRFCKNIFILTSSVFKRLSICIKNNRLSYFITLNGFWSNVFFSISENFILEKLEYIYKYRARVTQWGR